MTRRRVRDVIWSIAGLARISGVSPRTLRHYDAIGLLAPAWVAGNGWRHYEQEQLLRLQQILQNLGLGLRSVAEIPETRQPRTARSRSCDASVAGSSRAGAAAAPGAHHRPHDRRRSGRRRDARSSCVRGLRAQPVRSEARQRWGDDAVDASYQRMKGWSPADADKARTGYSRVHEGLAPLLAAGVPIDDDRVQELVHLHHEVTSLFWTPTPRPIAASRRYASTTSASRPTSARAMTPWWRTCATR